MRHESSRDEVAAEAAADHRLWLREEHDPLTLADVCGPEDTSNHHQPEGKK